jgi:hypothetical protein
VPKVVETPVSGDDAVRADVRDRRIRGLVERVCGRALAVDEDGPCRDGERTPTLRLRVIEQPEEPLNGPHSEQWTGEAPRFTVRFGGQLEASIDVENATVNGWVADSFIDNHPETAARLLVEAPVATVRAANGWQIVHAATLVGSAGAVVVRAGSDGGKSTIAAAAVRSGVDVLGDESVLVRRPFFDDVVASVREVLVRPQTATALGLDGEPTVTGEVKLRLELPPISSERRHARHVATVLLGDRNQPGGARLTSLAGDRLAAAFPDGAIPQERLFGSPDLLVRAWSRRPVYRLDGAVDLDGAVRLLDRLCRRGACS